MASIYALRDPRNNIVRYVGKSAQPQMRWAQHIAQSGIKKNLQTELKRWIRELVSLGFVPILEVMEANIADAGAAVREQFWIDKCRTEGAVLLNVNKARWQPKQPIPFPDADHSLAARILGRLGGKASANSPSRNKVFARRRNAAKARSVLAEKRKLKTG